MNDIFQLLLLSILGSIVALIGGVIFLYHKKWSQVLQRNSVSFAAGVLLTVTLIGLLPEATEFIGADTYVIVLITFLAAYIFEQIFFGIHHHETEGHEHEHKSSVIFVIIGDTIHNLIDGIAIGASFFVTPGLGLVTAISTFLHEVPHEIGDFGILLHAGWKKRRIVLVNVISAAITIVGAFSVIGFAKNELFIGVLLAISAGIFLYLGASDFLPHLRQEKKPGLTTLGPLLLGVLVMYVTLMLVPHK